MTTAFGDLDPRHQLETSDYRGAGDRGHRLATLFSSIPACGREARRVPVLPQIDTARSNSPWSPVQLQSGTRSENRRHTNQSRATASGRSIQGQTQPRPCLPSARPNRRKRWQANGHTIASPAIIACFQTGCPRSRSPNAGRHGWLACLNSRCSRRNSSFQTPFGNARVRTLLLFLPGREQALRAWRSQTEFGNEFGKT